MESVPKYRLELLTPLKYTHNTLCYTLLSTKITFLLCATTVVWVRVPGKNFFSSSEKNLFLNFKNVFFFIFHPLYFLELGAPFKEGTRKIYIILCNTV